MFNATNGEISEIQTWSSYNKKIKSFVNKANREIFTTLFKEDSERLLESFVLKCDRDFDKFLTYLTTDHRNNLLIHIVKINL